MEKFNSIMVVSRATEHCVNVLRYGISLARTFGAEIHLLHIIHDPFNLEGWNLPAPAFNDEFQKMIDKARKELDRIVEKEKAEGLRITEHIKYGEPADEIRNLAESENVDLILMLGHKEGRLEHFLYGKTNDAVIRQLPANLLLVKCG